MRREESICFPKSGVMDGGLIIRTGRIFFTACFGKRKTLSLASLCQRRLLGVNEPHPDTDYELGRAAEPISAAAGYGRKHDTTACIITGSCFRHFSMKRTEGCGNTCKRGCYRAGRIPLRAWAAVYAEDVIEADRQAEIEAARPKITIDLSHLEQIREDALITRDSLLTEEELDGSVEEEREKQTVKAQNDGGTPEALPAEEQDARAEQKGNRIGRLRFSGSG